MEKWTSPSEINYKDPLHPPEITSLQYSMQCSLRQGGAWRTQGAEVDSKTQHQWTKVQSSPDCVHNWQYSAGG